MTACHDLIQKWLAKLETDLVVLTAELASTTGVKARKLVELDIAFTRGGIDALSALDG